MICRLACLSALTLSTSLAPAQAQTDLFSPDTLSAYLDTRIAYNDGEASWTEDGIGKTRFGNGDDTLSAHIAEAGLVWRPRLSWTLTGYAHLQHTDTQDDPVGLVEGFVRYKPLPRSAWRWSGRAGVFFPPVSLEHEEEAWGTRFGLSPSAINSWIGEEIKGTGIEVTVEREIGGHELAVTGGVFGYNDTTAVLLRYRGWGLHDVKTNARGGYDVTIYPGHVGRVQPFEETDNRPGYYLRLDWSPAPGVAFNAIRWDNNADLESRNSRIRAWLTRFWNVGTEIELDDRHRLLGQVMTGTTAVGEELIPGRNMIDLHYSSAYAMLVREDGPHIWTARAEVFDTEERSSGTSPDFSEEGWSVTGSWRFERENGQRFEAEIIHVQSDRPLRSMFGIALDHNQTQIQLSWRISR